MEILSESSQSSRWLVEGALKKAISTDKIPSPDRRLREIFRSFGIDIG